MRIWIAMLTTLIGAGAAGATDFVTIRHSAEVAGTTDAVWAKIGDFCAISKLLSVPCRYASGEGDVGTVRSLVNGAVVEPMVGKTAHSYTYGQIVGDVKDFDYHGTLAVEPAGRGRSTIVYTIVYDQALMPSDEVRTMQRAQIDKRFQTAVDRAKTIAEDK